MKFIKFRVKIILPIFIIIASIVICGIGINTVSLQPVNAGISNHCPTVVIDAGHGGIDPGAIGIDGTLEKDINLSISEKLEKILKIYGFNTVMTRCEDSLICDDGLSSVREKKRSDITRRLSIFESCNDSILISIHQNKFSQSQYYGTQVFYSPNGEQSKRLAKTLQYEVVTLLQPDNKRVEKPVGSEIYLLYHAKKPAVMVECGFVSNLNELQRLKTDQYQDQMAFAIACGIVEYCSLK